MLGRPVVACADEAGHSPTKWNCMWLLSTPIFEIAAMYSRPIPQRTRACLTKTWLHFIASSPRVVPPDIQQPLYQKEVVFRIWLFHSCGTRNSACIRPTVGSSLVCEENYNDAQNGTTGDKGISNVARFQSNIGSRSLLYAVVDRIWRLFQRASAN